MRFRVSQFSTKVIRPIWLLVHDASAGSKRSVQFHLVPDGELDLFGFIDPETELLNAALLFPSMSIGFTIEGVRDGDLALLRLESPEEVTINIKRPDGATRTCRVRCHHGTFGQPCATCKKNGHTVKVCC